MMWGAHAIVVARSTVEPPSVASIKGYLFNSRTGQLGELDVLAPDDGGRWNDTDSDGMLVVVELNGPPNRIYDGTAGARYELRLVASDTTTSKRLSSTTRKLSVVRENGRLFVSFLVYMNRCSGVRVTVSVLGPGAAKPTERTAFFACGE
jgi:hypothetical protein